jgi:hypothetical protein
VWGLFEKSVAETIFSSTPLVFPVNVTKPLIHIHSCIIWGWTKDPFEAHFDPSQKRARLSKLLGNDSKFPD